MLFLAILFVYLESASCDKASLLEARKEYNNLKSVTYDPFIYFLEPKYMLPFSSRCVEFRLYRKGMELLRLEDIDLFN